MFTITGFADELGPDFETQMKLWKEMNLSYFELRSAWGVNVLQLSQEQLERIKEISGNLGIKVSCIGSPIGKTYIEEPLSFEMDRLKRACDIADFLGTDKIRVFSFYSKDKNILDCKHEVIHRLQKMAEYAKERDIILLHENEANVYGELSVHSAEIAKELKTDYFGLVFDPANYSVAGEDALSAEEVMHPYITYVHIKDYSGQALEMSIPGTGVSHIPEILDRLRDRDLFISMEPHLNFAGQFGGSTTPNNYKEAVDAVRKILKSLAIEFR